MTFKITKKINDIIRRDKKVIFTTTRGTVPFVTGHGDGDFAYDVSGNRMIDFTSFISVYNLGVNSNAQIRDAVKKQVDTLMHGAFTDFYSELPVVFTEKLLTMFPKGFGRVFYSNSGTEANEDAIKLSKIFTKRKYLLSFYNSFHGRSFGSLGLSASRATHKENYGPFPGYLHAPYPYLYRPPFNREGAEACTQDCIDYIKRYIFGKEAQPHEIAAIFLEPVQGEGGYIVPPKEFVKQLRELADEHQILLVSDEIQAGYFRTGKFLALDNFGVEADIYTMAKALGAGLPIGATIAKSKFGDVQRSAHGNTFGANLVSIAAANAALDYVKKNKSSLESQAKTKGKIISKRLNELKESYEIVGDARGIGMMQAIELVRSKKTKEPAFKEHEKVIEESFRSGLLLLPAGASSIRVIPPITISKENLLNGLDILEDAIRKENKKLGSHELA